MAELREGATRSECKESDFSESDFLKNTHIRRSDLIIELLMFFRVAGIRIEILHDKLTASQDSALGSELVAKLRLKLIDRQRQIAITGNIILHHFRNLFLMRPSEADSCPVFEL